MTFEKWSVVVLYSDLGGQHVQVGPTNRFVEEVLALNKNL